MAIPILHLYRLPKNPGVPTGQSIIHGKSLIVWNFPAVESSSMDCSFEQAVERLATLPRMFVELDGSFVWRGSIDASENCPSALLHPGPWALADIAHQADAAPEADTAYQSLRPAEQSLATWQLDGMLYDRSGRLLRVELQGTCPRSAWLQLLKCLQPSQELVAYLVEYGCFVLASDLLAIWDEMS